MNLSNFGPNTMTFVVPGEIFPPEVKATCHGISAACGKLGDLLTHKLFIAFIKLACLLRNVCRRSVGGSVFPVSDEC